MKLRSMEEKISYRLFLMGFRSNRYESSDEYCRHLFDKQG